MILALPEYICIYAYYLYVKELVCTAARGHFFDFSEQEINNRHIKLQTCSLKG